MIAQTVVEYGALHSISNAFVTAYGRVATFFETPNSQYILVLVAAVLAVLVVTRRRGN